mmetsp:Transcript_21359/g.26287  ORF Transcript_21359/g.26287 Transcript_21359/m.26287 type:complete len:114 (-) Transcript_21359:126-467(-)
MSPEASAEEDPAAMADPITETREVEVDENLSVGEIFQRAYEVDEELRKALELFEIETMTDENKTQILEVYNQVGAAGLSFEVELDESEIDHRLSELCETEPELRAMIDGANLT